MKGYLGRLDYGINMIAEIGGKNSEVLMDVIVRKFEKDSTEEFYEVNKEMALLLLSGEIEISWEGHRKVIGRKSVFEENPWCLHVARNVEVVIRVIEGSEILIQCTENFRTFESVLYSPESCKREMLDDGVMNDAERREVRTIFNYENAPYSNMVMGEVITYPNKVTNYTLHKYPQPEVFYYKFDMPQELLGDHLYRIKNSSSLEPEGGRIHPQTSDSCNLMYYCWMIRHLHGNPWRAITL
jgi:5-deoxy-glucuronate isomerase